MLNPSQIVALHSAARSAKACEFETGCPAALSIAQWALESGWGKFSPGNNCFGIKAYAGCYGLQTLKTHEYVKGKLVDEDQVFATFSSIDDCFKKHASLIAFNYRYAQAWGYFRISKDLTQFVKLIAPIYAPGNPTYAETVLKIMGMPEVQAALQTV